MIEITFPDGKKKSYKKGSTALDIAKTISEGLAREVVAAKFNDEIIDAFIPLNESGRLKLLKFEDPEGLEVYRHSSTHLMAQAVKRLFPYAKLTIGPVVEEGFYYDIDHESFSPEDIEKIEAEMKKIVQENHKCERLELSKNEALKMFKDNEYKIELINEMHTSKETSSEKAKENKRKENKTKENKTNDKTKDRTKEKITAYKQGEFIDLCRGPHIPRTGMIKAFKITKVAGAYWRGDSNNKQLQRLYGISFPDKKQLDDYLNKIEEAKKRDHRAIGKKMDLFSFNEISPGSPFFHPNGTIIFNELMQFIREEYRKRGYKEVITPLIYSKNLWQQSGHWDH